MNDSLHTRDPFYSTFAAVALAIVCLAACTSGSQRTAAPMPSVQAVGMSMVPGDRTPSSALAVDHTGTELVVAASDAALVGASIAHYDR